MCMSMVYLAFVRNAFLLISSGVVYDPGRTNFFMKNLLFQIFQLNFRNLSKFFLAYMLFAENG